MGSVDWVCAWNLGSVRRKAVTMCLCRGKMMDPVPESVFAAAPRREALDTCAHEQWEALQMYILDPQSSGPKLHKVVLAAMLTQDRPA